MQSNCQYVEGAVPKYSSDVEEVIYSSSVVEVENELEEEETGTYKASCVVAEESGKLGGERSEEGRCGGLVVVESCTPGDEGGGEGTCALVAAETGTCSASCVVVESGALGKGEGRACELVVVEESGKLGGELLPFPSPFAFQTTSIP
ncbi:hypothetical protein Ahy_B09g098859 isoform D [Arachis hypogaea]|uniref:Uncharacterized protein n=1 Tax=Arachis hypogaea TaxID=3818 RepID=A0A444XSB6_ARAHY|nr:hypothetical protein Ahy_B09g098859 isoform D [Arachis hypogaea]